MLADVEDAAAGLMEVRLVVSERLGEGVRGFGDLGLLERDCDFCQGELLGQVISLPWQASVVWLSVILHFAQKQRLGGPFLKHLLHSFWLLGVRLWQH